MMINNKIQVDKTVVQQDALLEVTNKTYRGTENKYENKEYEMKTINCMNEQSVNKTIEFGKTDVTNNIADEKNQNDSTTVTTEIKEKDERQIADEMAIQRVLAGDTDAFSELVVQYQRLVYHVANYYLKNSDDVDDASQEVFLRSYKSLSRYNPEYKFSTWLSSITKNYCLDVLRKKNKVTLVDIDECNYLVADNDTPEEIWVQREEHEELQSAVADLPEAYQEVVNLYHGQELSYLDMADKMGKPLSIVKNRLMRARRMLQKNLVVNELHG